MSIPAGISPNIIDAINAHWDAEIIDRFALQHHSDDIELLTRSRTLERYAFRQFVFSQCHSEADVARKLEYLRAGGPDGKAGFIAALVDDDRGDDLPAAFLRSLIITAPARAVPALPPVSESATFTGD
nr:hypothetical protein A4A59_19475 [Rhizobium leguminosarum]